jgi:hypothetical protein
MKFALRVLVSALALAAAALAAPPDVLAHCDGLDGPVVKAAQQALATGNVALALAWVQEKDETEIRQAFRDTLAVRGLGTEARALADRYFFETLVRVHRQGENAPYTGLKPAGRDLGPAIPAADKALEQEKADAVIQLLSRSVEDGTRARLAHALHAKARRTGDDVAAGREYVRAYVEFIHYVERLYEAAQSEAHGHYSEPGEHTMKARR